MEKSDDWYTEDTPTFDERHQVQNVRVINRMTWFDMMSAVAVGTVIGVFVGAFLIVAIGLG